jgi:hypothetical protein
VESLLAGVSGCLQQSSGWCLLGPLVAVPLELREIVSQILLVEAVGYARRILDRRDEVLRVVRIRPPVDQERDGFPDAAVVERGLAVVEDDAVADQLIEGQSDGVVGERLFGRGRRGRELEPVQAAFLE